MDEFLLPADRRPLPESESVRPSRIYEREPSAVAIGAVVGIEQ